MAVNEKMKPALLRERILPHFSRYHFFFNPLQIQQQSNADRRFLQRMFRERSNSDEKAFFSIECDEDELIENFLELYQATLVAETSAVRAYQLLLNSITYYYSRRTWSTSVQKYVIEFLEDSILRDFHERAESNIALCETQLICLLELFILKYGAESVNEDQIYNHLAAVRRKGGDEQLYAFVHGPIMNHFGCSLEPVLRRIFSRLDLKLKAYKQDQFTNILGNGKRNSFTQLDPSSSNGGRTSSEPTPTINSHSSSEEVEVRKIESTLNIEEDYKEKRKETELMGKKSALTSKAKNQRRKSAIGLVTKKRKTTPFDELELKNTARNTASQKMQTQIATTSRGRRVQPVDRLLTKMGTIPSRATGSRKTAAKLVAKPKTTPRRGTNQSKSTTRVASISLSQEVLDRYKVRMEMANAEGNQQVLVRELLKSTKRKLSEALGR